MDRAMVDTTERHREFIAGPAAERARLQVAKMVRVGWPATADEARLLGDIAKMLPVAITPWGSNGEDALVDADRSVRVSACGPGHLLRTCLGNCRNILFRRTCFSGSERRQPLFKGVLYTFSIGRGELVLGGQRLLGRARGLFRRGDLANLREQPIAQGGGLLAVNNRGRIGRRHSAATPIAGVARRRP